MKKIICSVFIAFLALSFIGSPSVAKELRLSILPTSMWEKVWSESEPLAQYISKKVNLLVEPIIANDISEYKMGLRKGEYDIVFEDPYIAFSVRDRYEVICVALNNKKKPAQRGVIITRSNSDVGSIEDLKSRTIVVTNIDSAGSFLSQQLTAKKKGLDVSRECCVMEAPDNKEENVIMSVYFMEADAGFIVESALKDVGQYVPPRKIEVVTKTEWVLNWVVAVKRDLPEKTKKAVQRAFTGMSKKHHVVKMLGLRGFQAASDQVLEQFRKDAGL
jgi:phosphonate transport system substrate-binding protein